MDIKESKKIDFLSKMKTKNILKIINELEMNEEENSKEDNNYSISGKNIKENVGKIKNSLIYENNSYLNSNNSQINENETKSFENYNKQGQILNLSEKKIISKPKLKKFFKKNKTNTNIITINHTQTNTLGEFIQRPSNKTNSLQTRALGKRRTFKKTIESYESISQIDDNQLTIRQRLTQFFDSNDRLFYLKATVSILTTLSYIYYLICTYKNKLFKSLNYLDFFICSLIIIEHIINILLAHHIFLYLISIESILYFFIEIPPFFTSMCSDFYLDKTYRFINITRVIRLTKSYLMIDVIQSKEKSVKNQILNIFFTLLLIILIFAGVIHILDLENVEEQLKIQFGVEERQNLKLRQHFHHYLYFIIVSLTTVGYGEIMPISILSQLMIIALVVVIIVVVPDQTNELINLNNSQTIYERKNYISSEDVPFIVLIGNIGLDALRSFCEEYFHKDHGKFYRHIVILINKFPNRHFEAFLNEKDNNKFIFYLQGDPMKSYDLLRTDILKAKSCIILSEKNTKDPFSEDQRALLLAIFIKKFYYLTSLENFLNENGKEISIDDISRINFKNNNFKIYLQLNKSESYQYYYSTLQKVYRKNMTKDQLLVIETLKMNLLSKSCITPGIISLLSNLIISSSTGIMKSKNEPEWLREYSEGTQYEIYKFSAEGQLLNFNYQHLTIELYNKFHSILIALEISFRGNCLIKLNPQNTETINEIIDKGLLLKSKKMRNGEDGLLYSFSSSDEDNKSNLEETENKADQFLKVYKLKKQIKVNFYLISKDKEVIDDILKMDTLKFNDLIKRRKSKLKLSILNSLMNFHEDKIQSSTLRNLNTTDNKRINTMKASRKTNHIPSDEERGFSDGSSISDEEIETKGVFPDIVNNNINKFNDYQQITNNYYTLENLGKNYLNTNEIMRQGIRDRNDIQHHVIICGMHPEIIHFILPLRAKYLTEKMLKWIVILAPVLPQEIYDALSIFPKIIFIQGDPLHPENLFRANITTADIAVILSGNLSKISNNIEFNDIKINNNKNENGSNNNSKKNKKNKKKLDEEILDSTTLFIYKSIRKINHSIKIITELLVTKNIEFLLPAKYLKKLYDQRKKPIFNSKNNKKNYSKDNDISSSYEMTPVFASGEIYLPSLVDKIIAQMYYNTNLLIILKLLLEGEKHIMKKKENKLDNLFKLIGSNLFMIPCEIKSESFGEMFKRMLNKNGILCIALYRKNLIDNFYYVYTNPRKTTLIRDTDFVFVLSGTDNIESLNDKNIFNISNVKEEDEIINDNNINNNEINEEENKAGGRTSIFQVLQESIQKQFNSLKGKKENNNIINSKNEDNNRESIINYNDEFIDKDMNKIKIRIDQIKNSQKFLKFKEEENLDDKKNYYEVEELQHKVNKSFQRLKHANQKFEEFEKEIKNYIKDEINNELFVYINKLKLK